MVETRLDLYQLLRHCRLSKVIGECERIRFKVLATGYCTPSLAIAQEPTEFHITFAFEMSGADGVAVVDATTATIKLRAYEQQAVLL